MFVETKSSGEAATKQPSLEGFIEWLAKQPADKEYDYLGCMCCLDQYIQTFKPEYKGWLGNTNDYAVTAYKIFDNNENKHYRVLAVKPWTYGAALARAKALRP